jgi:hypothetical protein
MSSVSGPPFHRSLLAAACADHRQHPGERLDVASVGCRVPAAAANRQAVNSRAWAERPDPPFGHWVEMSGEQVQAAASADIGLRERMARCDLSHLFVLHIQLRSRAWLAERDWTVRVLAAYLAAVVRGSGGGMSAWRWMSLQSPSMRR